jgi:hypothetical protein
MNFFKKLINLNNDTEKINSDKKIDTNIKNIEKIKLENKNN